MHWYLLGSLRCAGLWCAVLPAATWACAASLAVLPSTAKCSPPLVNALTPLRACALFTHSRRRARARAVQEVSDDEEEAEAKEAAEGEVEEVKPEDEAKEKKVGAVC